MLARMRAKLARIHSQPIHRALHAQRASVHDVEINHRRPHCWRARSSKNGTDSIVKRPRRSSRKPSSDVRSRVERTYRPSSSTGWFGRRDEEAEKRQRPRSAELSGFNATGPAVSASAASGLVQLLIDSSNNRNRGQKSAGIPPSRLWRVTLLVWPTSASSSSPIPSSKCSRRTSTAPC